MTSVDARAFIVAAGMLAFAACATTPGAPASPAPVTPAVSAVRPAEWRPSDRWVFEWTAGTDSGTKTAQVVARKEVNGVHYYAVQIGDVQHYYTHDLHWAGALRGPKVEARSVPPQPWFAWPLEVGRRWQYEATYEDPRGRMPQSGTFAVVGIETIEVPAGRFTAVKVVRETSDRDSDQYWYAPEVGWYVRWVGRRGDVEFEERLREYQPASRLIPAASAR